MGQDKVNDNDNMSLKEFAIVNDVTEKLDVEDAEVIKDEAVAETTDTSKVISNAPKHGYERLDKSIMPFSGRQYPAKMQFDVRGANTAEIRHWSSLDDTVNPKVLLDYFNDIIEKCVHVVNGSYADIKEADRLWFIFYIHALTFAEPEKPTILKCSCNNEACGHTWNSQLQYSQLQYTLPNDKMLKYLNTNTGAFDIQTKTYGVITMYASPSINVSKHALAFMQNKTEEWLKANKTFLDIAQHIVDIDSNVIESKAFQKAYNDWCSWDANKIATMIALVNYVKLTVKPSIQSRCPKCNNVTDQEFDLEGGIRSMFLPISNIDSELL